MRSEFEKKFVDLVRQPIKSEEEIAQMHLFRDLFQNELKDEMKELYKDLSIMGIECSDIWDLVNIRKSYKNGIEILIKHLSNNYHDKNKEGIIRALTTKEAKGKAGSALILEYNKTPKEKDNLRWVIANAISIVMTSIDINWVVSSINNKANGYSRRPLVIALGNFKSENKEDVLIALLDDDEVVPQAICALDMLKSNKAKERISRLLKSPNSLIRLEA